MTSVPDHERLITLMGLLIDQTIGADEIRELNDCLDGCRESQLLYKRYLDLHCSLRLELHASGVAVVATPVFPIRRSAIAAIVGALAVALVAVFVVNMGWPSAELKASLGQFEGDVVVTGVDGEIVPASYGIGLHPGYTIETRGSDSFATLVFSDKTKFVLVSNTSAAIDENELTNVLVRRGRLIGQVESQPIGNVFRVATPHARANVKGTQFVLESRQDRTDIRVAKGRITVADANDGQPVVVSQGKCLVANEGSALLVQETDAGNFEWSEDFESGLPGHWRKGDFESDELPNWSKGGVRAVKHQDNGRVYYQVHSQEEWARGLFAYRDDLHLNITFRMDQSSWANVFLIARTGDAESHKTRLHKYTIPLGPGSDRVWWKVTVPLSQFQLQTANGFENVPPTQDEMFFGMLLSSPAPDRGLVIDEVGVKRGGPGKVVLKRVE